MKDSNWFLLLISLILGSTEFFRIISSYKHQCQYPSGLDIFLIIAAIGCTIMFLIRFEYRGLMNTCRNESKQIGSWTAVFILFGTLEFITRKINLAMFTFYPIDRNMVSFDHFEILPFFIGGISLRSAVYAIFIYLINKTNPNLRDILKAVVSALIILFSSEVLVYLSGMVGPPEGVYEFVVFFSVIMLMFLLSILVQANKGTVLSVSVFTLIFHLMSVCPCGGDYVIDIAVSSLMGMAIFTFPIYAGYKICKYLQRTH